MNDWTDGQDILWEHANERFVESLPIVERNDTWWDTHSHRQHALRKLRLNGKVFAKLFAGDLGYYRVVPTNP